MAAAWSYSGETGPDYWASNFKDAGGKRQSPIDIETSKVKVCDMKEFTFFGFGDDAGDDSVMTLSNDGHSAKVSVSGGHYVTGGGLPGKFKVEQFHFHWGIIDEPGSEHCINGLRYPAELHIVTYDCDKFTSFAEALSDPDGVAVLGTLVEVGEQTNSGYDSLIKEFHKVQQKGQTIQLEKALALRPLMPENVNNFYRYDGSLTTPPCTECVVWTIFDKTVQISKMQMDQFRSLMTTSSEEEQGEYIGNNYRPLQALGDRVVTASFAPTDDNGDESASGKSCAIL